MHLLLIAALALPILVVVDIIWIGVIASSFYRSSIGHLMSGSIVWAPAIVFYLLYSLALAVFVIQPALAAKSLTHALLYGAFFGLVAYGVYDLTNHATLRDWPVTITLVDMAWGALLTSIVSGGAYLLATRFFGL